MLPSVVAMSWKSASPSRLTVCQVLPESPLRSNPRLDGAVVGAEGAGCPEAMRVYCRVDVSPITSKRSSPTGINGASRGPSGSTAV